MWTNTQFKLPCIIIFLKFRTHIVSNPIATVKFFAKNNEVCPGLATLYSSQKGKAHTTYFRLFPRQAAPQIPVNSCLT